jgi:hypothetical protein
MGGAGGGGPGTGGGSGGTPGSGGSAGTTGSGGGAGGSAGATGSAPCKRGIAANTPPGAAFFPAISWWYNWAVQAPPATTTTIIEFVPMIWGRGTVNAALPGEARYLLGFNEPNFRVQANMTPQQAADFWPTLQTKAAAASIPIVSPALNFCGPAAQCNGTDPYQYFKDFFAACPACTVNHIAVHWYNCDLPSLRDYLEPGGALEGFEQFGKPIWLTEFSCDPTASAASQEAFMRAAVPYLENNPKIFRYSWFSADPIPNARLINANGTPTALGQVYIGLPQNCR